MGQSGSLCCRIDVHYCYQVSNLFNTHAIFASSPKLKRKHFKIVTPNISFLSHISLFISDPNISASRTLVLCFKVKSKCKRFTIMDQTNSINCIFLHSNLEVSQPLVPSVPRDRQRGGPLLLIPNFFFVVTYYLCKLHFKFQFCEDIKSPIIQHLTVKI